jgi:hypothetical protein
MENVVEHSGSINDGWDTACFYETDNNSIIVYTVRLKKDYGTCFKWVSLQVSGTSQLRQLQNSGFSLPEMSDITFRDVYAISRSRMVIAFLNQPSEKTIT